MPVYTCDNATNANLPQRHARCQGRRSPEWVTARREVASAARIHAHQLRTRLQIMNWEEGREESEDLVLCCATSSVVRI